MRPRPTHQHTCTHPPPRPPLSLHQAAAYRYLDGMQALLERLSAAGVACHACSNYPAWWRLIEGKLELSRYLDWTFISCEGPMKASAGAWRGAGNRRLGLGAGGGG